MQYFLGREKNVSTNGSTNAEPESGPAEKERLDASRPLNSAPQKSCRSSLRTHAKTLDVFMAPSRLSAMGNAITSAELEPVRRVASRPQQKTALTGSRRTHPAPPCALSRTKRSAGYRWHITA